MHTDDKSVEIGGSGQSIGAHWWIGSLFWVSIQRP